MTTSPQPLPLSSCGYLRSKHSPPEEESASFPNFNGSLVRYIDAITYAIWEEKQTSLCHNYYSKECPVYTIAHITKGAEEVTEATNITLEAFPDRTLFPLGLVWGRDSSNKYHSSHLISSRLTHKGATEHGPPTGRRARILTIAHCVIDNEVIVEEWLVRDNYTLAVQLGCDPHDLARQRAQKPAQKRLVQWLAAEYARVVDDSSVSTAIDGLVHEGGGGGASRICAQLHEMWNAGSTADSSKLVTNLFHKHAFVRAPAGRELVGHEDLEEYYASWFAAFPNARWRIDFATNACSLNGPTAVGSWLAVRWTMAGEHEGTSSRFGDASGSRVVVLGEMHLNVHAETNQIVEGYFVYDEIAVLEQIERGRVVAAEPAPANN